MSSSLPTILIIGGTGAQGIPIVQTLAKSNLYTIRILTRDPTSPPPNVHLLPGDFTSEASLRTAFTNAWAAYVNIDGFAAGEALEMFYTVRCYEIAVECGVVFYIHANIDFYYELGGYNPLYRCGHGDAKGRMWEWMRGRNALNQKLGLGGVGMGMKVAALTTGPYVDMAIEAGTPVSPRIEKGEDGEEEVVTWRLPLGEEGAVAHTALEDVGVYAGWLFERWEEVDDGVELKVGMGHVHYRDVARAFEEVTGRKARFVDVDFETYFGSEGGFAGIGDAPTGYMVEKGSPGAMSVRTNFTGWWHAWRASGGNKGLVKRDYALLDEIHPGRIRTVEEFFRREAEKARFEGKGTLWDVVASGRTVLKINEDGRMSV
ncbi:hypothetical protein QBC34DRAFT_383029 [Podospora aff. communis PSN243]|uniref:NmrA-like domain-containing protein n=1 Tax=Podospora aff. communis PSN243 TaxID=3040156 RepID=A0AAV9GH98_9PEZI|nr:hypothetical protein QBC34DRAFT_383029 [Podospora aff. communis PSN243]